MLLYHATSAANCEAIKREGFARSNLKDSEGCSWFWSERPGLEGWAGSATPEYLVIVEVPREEAEPHRYRFEDGTPYLSGYLIPWDVVNTRRPFRYEAL
jgi:hypothetical protein